MRFLHLSDLHFGKSIHGVSLLENGDQDYWADRFLELTEELRPDAVVIAGDVYDRSAPSGDAVQLLSRMLTALARRQIPVMLVAGNHDSLQRLSFASPLLAGSGIHISPALSDSAELSHVTLQDAYGPVTFWLMPYLFPAQIERVLGEDCPRDYDGAVRALLARQPLDKNRRNVLIAHQNVTANGAESPRGGSESMVGGVGQIDYTAFDAFDYVALGHIHAAYPVGRESVRYAGSPLCYHFDETRQPAKGPLLVEIREKGSEITVETRVLPPLHPMREWRGNYEELRRSFLDDTARGEYLRVVLTDRRVSPEEADFFRELAASRDSVLMEISSEYDPFGERGSSQADTVREQSVEELFACFYAERAGGEMPDAQEASLLRFAGELTRQRESGIFPTQEQTQRLLRCLLEQEAGV